MILDEISDNLEVNKKKISIKVLKKMKNGIHLEDAEFFKLKPNYLKSVKKVGLGKQFQVSGYFYAPLAGETINLKILEDAGNILAVS